MAPVFDVDIAVFIEFRHGAVIMSGQSGPGKDKVQLCQKLQVYEDGLHIGDQLHAEGSQHHFDLLLLPDLQLPQLVV